MTAITNVKMDQEKLQRFQMKVLTDIGAVGGVACAYIGDKVGLYKELSKSGPVDSQELAQKTGTSERYVREWLINQAAGGYVEYDAARGKYWLSPEQASVLADEESTVFACGGFQAFLALMHAAPRMIQAFRDGKGLAWGDHHAELFEGTERFFRPAYVAQLVSMWIPSIKGLKEKLEAGADVADVGCGHGASTLIMARAFPKSRFFGFDNHAPSIEKAQKQAKEEGLSERLTFKQCAADAIPEAKFDLICFFDCLHDMGNPVAACSKAKLSLKPDGCLMIVEPMAGRTVEENFNELGRTFTGASVLCCTPNAIASGGRALGTVATDDALKAVLNEAGFRTFNRAVGTPFNRVFEARL